MFPFKVLEERYNSIPDNVRQAISSTEVNRKLKNIVDRYKLQLDEGEELTKEIGYVMLGLRDSGDFIKNIQKATELDKATAEKIAEDINNIILKEIKTSLRIATQKPDRLDEEEDNFDEEKQQQVRDELIKEIETPTENIITPPTNQKITTDLIKKPEQELQKIDNKNPGSKPVNKENYIKDVEDEKSNQPKKEFEQNLEKDYIIDPYREPIE
ncbi:MAG: hypothetical protein U9P50_01915 [Patescibacteria group bacterium]|nr:hypothetical protein [Patescibacteria group bacterium]